MNLTKEQLAKYVDYTKLKADATKPEIQSLIKEAIEYKVKAVCVNPHWVKLCSEELKGSGIEVATVVGFPLGANMTSVKVMETYLAITAGATEIDMVINVGAIKSNDWDLVRSDIASVVEMAHSQGTPVKVILETCLLTFEEKKRACEVCLEAKADFVKTSTGFSTGGATVEDIQLMKSIVGDKAGIKASGGVRTYEQALAMIESGATRLGTSSVSFLQEQDQNQKSVSSDTY